jgi:hypothetical protein
LLLADDSGIALQCWHLLLGLLLHLLQAIKRLAPRSWPLLLPLLLRED